MTGNNMNSYASYFIAKWLEKLKWKIWERSEPRCFFVKEHNIQHRSLVRGVIDSQTLSRNISSHTADASPKSSAERMPSFAIILIIGDYRSLANYRFSQFNS